MENGRPNSGKIIPVANSAGRFIQSAVFSTPLVLFMDSSDEDFLPDPERYRGNQVTSSGIKKKPPDKAGGT